MRCVKCGQEKDKGEFAWRNRLLGIRQKACRSCRALENKQWYERHHERHRENVKERLGKSRDEAQRFIYEYLSNQVCADCGTYDFAVMTFDHVRGKKKMDVMTMVYQGYSVEAIMKEIAKCEVVCANCHMWREQKRRGSSRFEKYWPKFPDDYEKKDDD
jgi:hypothetical protein